jgi:predicted transcriptional regulator
MTDLFSLPHNGVATSIEAAESMVKPAAAIRERVYNYIKSRAHGAICDEAEDALGLRHQTCSARFKELADAGRIIRTMTRRKTRSGRNAFVYVAV